MGALLALFSMAYQPVPTALQEFNSLNQQAHAAKAAGDKRAYLAIVLKMKTLLNDTPEILEAAARAYAATGDMPHALATLSEFAELGETDAKLLNGKDESFSGLRDLPPYKSILERLAQNKTAISRAETVFILPDAGILAEDLDFDPRSKTFLITSVLEKKIVRVRPDGTAMDFASSPSHWPMLAIKVDLNRKLVWATEVALDGFTTVPKADWGRSAVLCFDLESGALLRRLESPKHAALGDLVLAQNGDPIVSDGGGGVVYRVTNGRWQEIDKTNFISPQTPAITSDGNRVFVPDYVRGIAILELDTRHVSWLNCFGSTKVALNGVDGLYFDRASLILTQNGTSPPRVVRIQLDKTLTQITSQEIIERATATLGDPTHGVIAGDYFFYIANSGWSNLDEHGELKAGSRLSPARIMRFQLR